MTRALLALAALAAVVVALRRRRAPQPDADDSEVVGMPTTYALGFHAASGTDQTVKVNYTIGPGWYVEFAPTSRN